MINQIIINNKTVFHSLVLKKSKFMYKSRCCNNGLGKNVVNQIGFNAF